MTVSTASISSVNEETHGFDNLSPTAGSWRNGFWPIGPSVNWGIQRGKFPFDFEGIAFKFSNMTPAIPANAKIISAKLRGTAAATSTGVTFLTIVEVLGKDSLWDLAAAGPKWVSASGAGFNFDADVVVLNTVAATLVDTGISTTHNWSIRDNSVGRYLKVGQGVDVVTAGTLGFADISLGREGTPGAGNIWCEIYSQDGAGLADTLLATSNTRVASTAPASTAPFRFTFSGGEQISLSAGQKIVVVLNGDYPLNAGNNVRMGWSSGGYAPGTFQIFGTGVGFDDQNYPMQRNFRNAPFPYGFGVWQPPGFTIGVDYDTPEPFLAGTTSFVDMLSGYISSGSYVEGDPIGVKILRAALFFPPTGNVYRQWASFLHATFSPVRLIVEWKPRAIRIT